MSKFKIGDKVRILDGSDIDNYAGSWCAAGMKEYVGEVRAVVDAWSEGDGITAYRLEGTTFKWDERGLEIAESKFKVGDKVVGNKKADNTYSITRNGWVGIVTAACVGGIDVRGKGPGVKSMVFRNLNPECFDLVSEQKIVITTDGKYTTAKLYDGKKVVKTAKASCAPEDTFDFNYGASLALDRLTGFVRGTVDCTLEEKPSHDKSDWDKFFDGNLAFEMDSVYYDAFLKEVEKKYPRLCWCGGEKPTAWKPGFKHCYFLLMEGSLCYDNGRPGVETVQWAESFDWNKFAHGKLEVKVSKENLGEFLKQCEAKKFTWPHGGAATGFDPWEVYEMAKGSMRLIMDIIGVIPAEYIWIAFDADDDCLRWGPKHDEDVDEYEFV